MFIEKLQTPLTVDNAIIQLGDIDDSQKGRQFKSRFIQAGIAGYPKQFGNVLITKETLDKFVNTLVNKPVIINHKDEIKPEDEVGKVTKVWFNAEDGWFWCEGYLTNETAINLIKDKGWSVSCSYDVLLLDDEGGTENNIKYDKEFLNGKFTHLAIVENPRYERANIVVNSKTEIVNSFEGHAGRKGQIGGSLPKGTNPNLSEDIDKVIAGTFPKKEMLNFGTPPNVLQDLGVPDKPMFMAQHKYLMSTERKEIDGEIHHITDETMKDLPNLLKEPLLVMTSRKNANRYVVAINAKDKNEKYIFVIIDYDWQGKKNNIIPSVYGKDEYLEYIKKAYINNEIVYQDKNLKISGSRVQFPRCNPKVSNTIINDINEYFNPNVKESKTMEIDNARGFDGEEGDWITIKGVHVFVKKGQSKEEAVADFIEKQQGKSDSKPKVEKDEKKVADYKKQIHDKYKSLKDDEEKKAYFDYLDKQTAEFDKDVNYKEAVKWLKDVDKSDIFGKEAEPKAEEKNDKFKSRLEDIKNRVGTISKGEQYFDEKVRTAQKMLKTKLEAWEKDLKENEYSPSIKQVKERNINIVKDELRQIKELKSQSETNQPPKRQVTEEELFGKQKEDEKTDKGSTLEGGIKETKDKYGRTNFTKGNKWANVTSNGGRSDSWIAAYGLTHKSGVSWEAEKGITEEQLLNSRSFKTEKGARKWALEQLKRITSDNSKEQDMSLLNKLINLIKEVQNNKGAKMDTKTRILSILNEKEVEEDVIEEVENELEEIEKEKEEKEAKNKKCKNEKVDKRKLIDEVGGILKGKVDDEIIRTVIGKIEKAAYDESEAGADNKKAKNEDEEKDEKEVKEVKEDVKEDVDNKCKNSVYNATDYFNKVNEVYNSSCKAGIQTKYETQADRLEAGNKF